jgi:hypothetical protein
MPLLGGVVAYVLGDLHRPEVRPAACAPSNPLTT